jgi:nucleotide-binding universal stress UspA family protein
MNKQLFHIFRNTPLGRETFLQSLYFCNMTGVTPVVYIPEHTKFLMYFENDVVQVDLDESYRTRPETAEKHASELLENSGIKPHFLKPRHFTASTLPDIKTDFDFMCCPRSISDLSSKIGLGYIGPRVRRIVQAARFPVLLTSPIYKPWNSITVFFGGSQNAVNAFKLGLRISRESGLPIELFTRIESGTAEEYRKALEKEGLKKELAENVRDWHFFEEGRLEDNLYEVPHDTLVVLGAYGHGLIRDFVFGNKMERIQSTISNNMLIAGPKYTAPL